VLSSLQLLEHLLIVKSTEFRSYQVRIELLLPHNMQ
jgi:hypothetical protein